MNFQTNGLQNEAALRPKPPAPPGPVRIPQPPAEKLT
jgi:hypothetical protein